MKNFEKSKLPSYRDIAPSEIGGRIAREGFDYQDHIGVGFGLDLIENERLTEVWYEQHDDIALIYGADIDEIEMVQVKHEDMTSRYSVASLTSRKKGRVGSSLLERSLARSAGKEETRFRLVTSYGVTSELNVLTNPLNSPNRLNNSDALADVKVKIVEKIPDAIAAPDGTTIEQWIERCYWDKREDTKEAVQNNNLLRLEKVLNKLGLPVFPDQRDEIYWVLLKLVKQKSGLDGLSNYKLTQEEIEDRIKLEVNRQRNGAAGGQNLKRKLKEASLADFIDDASDLYYSYRRKTLDPRYSLPSEFEKVESEVAAKLSLLRTKLYLGEVAGGLPFLKSCLDALEEVRNHFDESVVTTADLQGMMYTRTNRCAHRFSEPTS